MQAALKYCIEIRGFLREFYGNAEKCAKFNMSFGIEYLFKSYTYKLCSFQVGSVELRQRIVNIKELHWFHAEQIIFAQPHTAHA